MKNIDIGQTVLGYFREGDSLSLGTIAGVTQYPERTCVLIDWQGPNAENLENTFDIDSLYPVEDIFHGCNTFGLFIPNYD